MVLGAIMKGFFSSVMLIFLVLFPINAQYGNSSYCGIYDDPAYKKSGGEAKITVYQESENSIMFYINIQKGPPSYNMGSLFGKVSVDNGTAVYTSQEYDCKWSMTFTKNSLIIRTLQNKEDCGFGNAVYAEGTYKKVSSKNANYFINEDGKKVYFNQMSSDY